MDALKVVSAASYQVYCTIDAISVDVLITGLAQNRVLYTALHAQWITGNFINYSFRYCCPLCGSVIRLHIYFIFYAGCFLFDSKHRSWMHVCGTSWTIELKLISFFFCASEVEMTFFIWNEKN